MSEEQKLISDAAKAAELFSEDELERYAEERRKLAKAMMETLSKEKITQFGGTVTIIIEGGQK